MLKLNDRNWKVFLVGDIFPMVSRPKARSEKQYHEGSIPFVASGNINNGVIKCCKLHTAESLDKGACITVSPVDGSAFYHEYDFLGRGGAGSSIIMLRRDGLNRQTGLFLSRMLRRACEKYCYGKMGNQDTIKKEKILLPVNDKDEPDYSFMEAYIKERENALLARYKAFVKSANIPVGGGNIIA